MRLIRKLMFVGAGLVLTACGGGGGDGLSGSSYDNEIVVRVVFENLTDFRNVAAVDGDYSDVRVTFDMDQSITVNYGDISFYYNREYTGTEYDEFVEVQQHDGVRFVEIPDVDETYSLQGKTLEWVADRTDLNAALEDAEYPLNAERLVYVIAEKDGSALTGASDYIPGFLDFEDADDSGRIPDAQNDWTPSGGTSAVDLRSVQVLFF